MHMLTYNTQGHAVICNATCGGVVHYLTMAILTSECTGHETNLQFEVARGPAASG